MSLAMNLHLMKHSRNRLSSRRRRSNMDAGISLRRSELSDVPLIAELIQPQTAEIFGDVNLVTIIEKAILGITVVDQSGKVVGHASFTDAPEIPGVPVSRWHRYLQESYVAPGINPINTATLSLFVVQEGLEFEVVPELFRMLFVAIPIVTECLLGLPGSTETFAQSALALYFKPLEKIDNSSASVSTHSILRCQQASLSPPLYVRVAEPEDFDDLRPIFNAQSEVLRSRYGGDYFYLAELIEAAAADGANALNACFVAEVDGKAVGMMSLSTDVDIKILQEGFDLKPLGGVPSAVAITMFCIEPQHESHSLDFMSAVFAHFKEVDCCVLTVPHDVPELPLLTNFTKATPVSGANVPHELWVMHRDGLREDIVVRPYGKGTDKSEVQSLLSDVVYRGRIESDLEQEVAIQKLAAAKEAAGMSDETIPTAFVVECGGAVVGVAVCRNTNEDALQVRAHFEIEEFVIYPQYRSTEHGYLDHFMLAPAYDRHSKYILREIMRLGRKSCIYHRLYSKEDSMAMPVDARKPTPASCLHYLVPVRRRRQIDYPHDVLKSNVPSARVRELKSQYTLTFMCRKLIHEPKVAINARVVVVGSSVTALSFLETVVFKPHLRFGNLTLVSPSGFEDDSVPCLPRTHAYSQPARKAVGWGNWIDVVPDSVTAIDRENRVLTLASGAVVPYDYLVLTPDLEYPEPEPGNAAVSTLNRKSDFEAVVKKVTAKDERGVVIVYGDSLDSAGAVTGLMNAGVTAERLTYVLPVAEGAAFDGDVAVNKSIIATFQLAGITVVHGCEVTSWGSNGRATFKEVGSGAERTISFVHAVQLDKKAVNEQLFTAVNDACLVFDGRLVVSNQYQTNDDRIYAAGTFTKFSRKYHPPGDPVTHACTFNSKEVGAYLAGIVLGRLDPLAEEVEPKDLLLPRFTEPLVESVGLADGRRLLRVGPPGAEVPQQISSRGAVLVTDTGKFSRKMFELRFDPHRNVCGMVCLAPADKFSVYNLICLYGLHEKLLNKVHSRHAEGIIPDLFDFLDQPWAMALYHDRFKGYMADILEEVGENPAIDVKQLELAAVKLAKLRASTEEDDFWHVADQKQLDVTVKYIADDAVGDVTRTRLMEFLDRHTYHLPMYARPTTW